MLVDGDKKVVIIYCLDDEWQYWYWYYMLNVKQEKLYFNLGID